MTRLHLYFAPQNVRDNLLGYFGAHPLYISVYIFKWKSIIIHHLIKSKFLISFSHFHINLQTIVSRNSKDFIFYLNFINYSSNIVRAKPLWIEFKTNYATGLSKLKFHSVLPFWLVLACKAARDSVYVRSVYCPTS